MTVSIEGTQRTKIGWNELLRAAAIADLVVMAVVGAIVRDKEALIFAALILAAIVFLRVRHGAASIAILGVLSLDVAAFMVPAAAANTIGGQSLNSILIPLSLATISLAGFAAACGSLFRRRRPAETDRAAPIVLQVVIGVFVLATIAGVVQQRGEIEGAPQTGDVLIDMRNTGYVRERVTVADGGGLAMTNHDLFWHTVTIDALDLNVDLPTGAHRRVVVSGAPGSYEFYCRVPGHKQAGMKGTLIVT